MLHKLKILATLTLLLGALSCKKDKNDPPNTPPPPSNPFAGCNDIRANTTVAAGSYLIDCEVEVTNNAVLTLRPGVVLQFTGNGSMKTTGGGAIHAAGTVDKPIVFTGREALKGYWFGLDINTNSLNNYFEHCRFEYGGKGVRTMVRLGSGGSLTTKAVFKSCTFSNGKKTGLFVNEQSSIDGSSGNTFTGNEEYPVSVAFQNVSELDTSNTYTGNGMDRVLVYTDEISANITGDVTFNKIAVPYFLSNTAAYLFKGKVTVSPGVTLVMEANTALRIDASGSFYCVGTASERITIRGLEAVKGYWDRITFKGSPSVHNNIQYTDISDGGSETTEVGLSTQPGVITTPGSGLGDGTRLTVKNCTISNSKKWAIYLNGVNHTVNELTGSSNIKISLEATNTFSGNSSGNVFVN